jgi:DNA-binding transcriptional ArsR family regulator
MKFNTNKMTFNQISEEQLELAANMLKAIAHPLRISILRLLEAKKSLTVTEIHEKLGIEQSTASHHLGILKDKGVLLSKRAGKNSFYSLKNENLSHIVECISKCSI